MSAIPPIISNNAIRLYCEKYLADNKSIVDEEIKRFPLNECIAKIADAMYERLVKECRIAITRSGITQALCSREVLYKLNKQYDTEENRKVALIPSVASQRAMTFVLRDITNENLRRLRRVSKYIAGDHNHVFYEILRILKSCMKQAMSETEYTNTFVSGVKGMSQRGCKFVCKENPQFTYTFMVSYKTANSKNEKGKYLSYYHMNYFASDNKLIAIVRILENIKPGNTRMGELKHLHDIISKCCQCLVQESMNNITKKTASVKSDHKLPNYTLDYVSNHFATPKLINSTTLESNNSDNLLLSDSDESDVSDSEKSSNSDSDSESDSDQKMIITAPPKATLYSEWYPYTVEVSDEHGGDEFMQYMYKITYDDEPMILQMPWTRCVQGGIPGTHYEGEPKIGHENQGKCDYYNHKFNPSNKEDMVILKKLQRYDKLMGSKEMMSHIFGKSANKHVYIPCVRKTSSPTANNNPMEFFFHIKVKIKTLYMNPATETSSNSEVTGSSISPNSFDEDPDYVSDRTIFSKKNPKVLSTFRVAKKDGKGYDKQDVQTIPEARRIFTRNCEYRDVLHFMHVWEKKAPNTDGLFEYGVTIKMIVIDIKPPVAEVSNPDDSDFVEVKPVKQLSTWTMYVKEVNGIVKDANKNCRTFRNITSFAVNYRQRSIAAGKTGDDVYKYALDLLREEWKSGVAIHALYALATESE